MPTTQPGRNGGTLVRSLPGETSNPYGRPKKMVSGVLADLKAAGFERVSPTDVVATIESLINLPQATVRQLSKDNEQPMIVRIVAEAMLSKKSGFSALEAMLDRAHGKAKQQVDLSGAGAVPVPTVTVIVQPFQPPEGQPHGGG